MSPSQALIFSTLPAGRGATWTSSTSIVPETALLGRRQPARASAQQLTTRNNLGTAMAKGARIIRMKTCALCAGNTTKGNGRLLKNAAGAKARHQGRREGRYPWRA